MPVYGLWGRGCGRNKIQHVLRRLPVIGPIGKEAPGKAGRLTFALIKGARLHAMVYTAMATKHSMVASVWAE